jgi:hypothetical protein
MTVKNEGGIVTKDLAFLVDGASTSSFKGTPANNLASYLIPTNGIPGTNESYFKALWNQEDVFIPAIGWTKSQYVDIYNDYPAGWSGCCPNIFWYGSQSTVALTGNTLYTYQIIYKTSDDYYHPNYLYRYEQNSSNTYLTEGNVGDFGVNGNRVSLGDGWYMAWGQFTSQPTAANAVLYSFHYKYNYFTRVYVAAITLTAGSNILPAKYMLDPAVNRGATVATQGGWLDLSGNDNHGTLVASPTYTTEFGGAVVHNGTTQYTNFNIANLNFDREQTIIMVLKKTTNFTNRQNPWNQNYGGYGTITWETNGVFNYYWGSAGGDTTPYDQETSSFAVANNELAFIAVTRSSTSVTWYKNGVQYNSKANTSIPRAVPGNTTLSLGSGYTGLLGGNIYYASAYTRSLTAAEIKQNFDALKGRFGL